MEISAECNDMENHNNPIRWNWLNVRGFLLILAAVLSLWIVYQNVSTLFLLSLSFLLSYLLNPLICKMENKGLSRTVSITILVAVLLLAGTGLTLMLIPQITQQTQSLFQKYQYDSTYLSNTPSTRIQTNTPTENDESHFVKWFDTNINPILRELGLEEMKKEDLRLRIQGALQWIDTHYPQWSQSVWNVFQSTFSGVTGFIVGILNLLLVPVFTFYLLRDYPILEKTFYSIIPPHWRNPVADWMRELDRVVGGFIRGQFSIALILATINAVGLSLLGIPFGFLIGFIAGMANMVPYMSIVVGLIPAVLFSFLDRPDLWRAVWVIVIFCGAQMLEGFYLSPRIMGQEVGLHPVLIMLAIIIGGSLLGLVGILLAVPLAAILKVIVVRSHAAWKKQWPESA